MAAKEKMTKKRVRATFSLPLYLLVWAICALIGFLEGGLIGAIVGLCSGLFCSLFTLCGLIPFGGIFVYWYASHWINGLLTSLGVSVPFAQGLAFWFSFVFALIAYLFITVLTTVALLAILARPRR